MPFHDWPRSFAIAALVIAVLFVLDALRRADWQRGGRDNLLWLFTTVMILLARQMTVSMPGGMSLQYLGAAWLALLHGYPRAVVSMTAIYLLEAVAGLGLGSLAGVPLLDLSLPLLLLGIAPAWLMWAIVRGCRRWLPANLFIFLLGAGFLGIFASYVLPLLGAGAISLLMPGPHPGYWQTMLPYAILLSAGETWLEGMMTTLLVVYLPGSVRLFDEQFYLRQP